MQLLLSYVLLYVQESIFILGEWEDYYERSKKTAEIADILLCDHADADARVQLPDSPYALKTGDQGSRLRHIHDNDRNSAKL